jgi:DNA-binding NarL/FixJ family response regulator
MMTSVFNADDHPILRKGITELLNQAPGLTWVGSAADGQESLDKIRSLKPDIAILDIEMPHYNGLEVAKMLLKEGSSTRFILLTFYDDKRFLQNAIFSGIKGYLLKESNEDEILACIDAVAKGRSYVNASLTHHLIGSSPLDDNLGRLSKQELNVLKLIARQKNTKEIAEMLFLSPKTIANHRNSISKKLELGGEQNGLLKWALEHRGEIG